ncbi:GNAT family N-acetyltransferase [Pseudomonas costantinii]|uniref:GNAT family N-acetyltransferase n=1 Tax=Pseudomonas costantinii TaxID=168469 RepID=A0A1S2UXN0_9PSED|nr:GNAT family N-acetyltransferase [Pseudomonas costantinii]NVZ19256.1 GNAT family N-acetyltransferase [Pseudomonas costantinii]NVZ68329.1 GNAT family N-acetyltransferase [Pseudomonas costantinii]OIN51201.1 GNAT family N-acetyltransferase [Pseudomonas costantinii]SED92081.1 Peptidogalycan biosysnthesis/recognition [Pseudomonas costantinii]
MTDPSQAKVTYACCMEAQSLVDSFVQHPPAGFDAQLSKQGLPYFFTRFDLLTTADDAFRARLRGWPGYGVWSAWLHIDTCFIGTTVTEYSVFPRGVEPQDLAQWLQTECVPHRKLTILKDLPVNSPLLSAEDNLYAQALIEACTQRGFINVEGQALAYVPIDFQNIDEYLSRLSHSRRRNIRRKLRSREQLRIETLNTGDARFNDQQWQQDLYRLYKAVYDQSEIHFDLLTPEFFTQLLTDAGSGGHVFFYWHEDELVGYNLCYEQNGKLLDKYIGLNYDLALKHNLYFVSWFVNLEYALEKGLQFYVAGWTDPQVKAGLGAQFTFTRHLVAVRNPLLRRVLNHFRHHFESDTQWHQEKTS